VGESTAKPAWRNTKKTPTLAQTVGKLDKAFLTSEVSEFQIEMMWKTISIFPLNLFQYR